MKFCTLSVCQSFRIFSDVISAKRKAVWLFFPPSYLPKHAEQLHTWLLLDLACDFTIKVSRITYSALKKQDHFCFLKDVKTFPHSTHHFYTEISPILTVPALLVRGVFLTFSHSYFLTLFSYLILLQCFPHRSHFHTVATSTL